MKKARKRLAKALLALALIFGGAVWTNVTIATEPVSACSNASFLGFRAWYWGLRDESTCELKKPVAASATSMVNAGAGEVSLAYFVWKLVFNIAAILTQLIAYGAVLFVLVGGFHVLFSSGDPGKVAKGKTTITNALIGVVIAVFASGAVRFVSDTLIGTGTPTLTISSSGNLSAFGFATNADTIWTRAIANFLYTMGIAAVGMIVFGGVKMSASAGNPQAQAKARNTIIFALVGMVICILGGTIVNIAFNATQGQVN